MSSKSDYLENAILALIFDGTAITGIAQNHGTPLTDLYVALYTANPDETGSATTNETAYTNYARVAVTRGAGWTVSADTCNPAADIDFAECGATPGGPITHFAIVDSASGAGNILYYGPVTPNITMAQGVIPRIKSTSSVTEG